MKEFFEFEGNIIPTHTTTNGETFYQVQATAASLGMNSLSLSPSEVKSCQQIGRLQYANKATLINRLKRVGKKDAKSLAYSLIQRLSEDETPEKPSEVVENPLTIFSQGHMLNNMTQIKDALLIQIKKYQQAVNAIEALEKALEK